MKTYIATITQYGTNAPEAYTVHINTLGGTPIFTRTGAGQYEISGPSIFPEGKYVTWLGCPADDNNGWVNQVQRGGTILNMLTYNNGVLEDNCMASEQSIFIQVYD